MNKALESEN